MGKSSAPPPPDYAALAAAQGAENKDTATFNSNLNRVNQITPQGSSTWQLRPGADPNNPQPGDYTQTTSLAPGQQSLYDSGLALSNNLAGVAQAGLGRVGAAMATPFDQSGMNPLTSGVQPGQQTTGVSTAGLPGLANGQSYADQVRAVQDATYSRAAPQLAQNRREAESRLLNSGIEKGTQGWDDAQRTLGQNENDASMASILAGSQEQSRIAGLDQGARAQMFGEGMSNANLNNSSEASLFGQGMSNANLNNQTAQQAMQQQAYMRQLPLNEINALRSGSQTSMPSFSGYYTGGQAQAAPTYQAGADTYNAGLASTNADNASNAGLWGTVGTIGAGALMAF